jgi:Helix-turn-helix domain of resolvase.
MRYDSMGRKPVEDFQVKRIILLRSEGASISQIVKDTGLGKTTVQKYIEKYAKDIEKMKNKPQELNKVVNATKVKESDQEKKKDNKPKIASVEDETTKNTIRKAADSVSTLKAKEITEDYKAAQMLHSASVRYQKNVEMMGLEWDRFIAWAIDQAYAQAVTAYEEKVEERLREVELLENEMNEKLENPEGNMESVVEEEVEE